MQDITPRSWTDYVADLTDANLNQEIRNSYMLLLNPPVCSVKRSSNTSIPTGTYMTSWTEITWDTLLFDTEAPADPMFSASSATRITCRTAGWYLCVASGEENNLASTAILTAAFRVNGSAIYVGTTAGRNASPMDVSPANFIPLSAGDYIELIMTHDNASAVTILGTGGNAVTMTIARLRGL